MRAAGSRPSARRRAFCPTNSAARGSGLKTQYLALLLSRLRAWRRAGRNSGRLPPVPTGDRPLCLASLVTRAASRDLAAMDSPSTATGAPGHLRTPAQSPNHRKSKPSAASKANAIEACGISIAPAAGACAGLGRISWRRRERGAGASCGRVAIADMRHQATGAEMGEPGGVRCRPASRDRRGWWRRRSPRRRYRHGRRRRRSA